MAGCGSRYHANQLISCENPAPNHVVCTAFDPEQWTHLHWDNPTYEPPPEPESKAGGREKARKVAARTEPPWTMMDTVRKTATGLDSSSTRWTDEQRAQVTETIIRLAYSRRAITADDIWAACPEVPPGPGVHALLTRAVQEKLLTKGDFADSQRNDRADHDRGRRLRVWRSLVYGTST
jgi:hypothetical protein